MPQGGMEILMDKYIIFLDIDGTLSDISDGTVSPENADAIKRVRKLGHYVFINTGRSYAWIPRSILEGAELDGTVSGMGTQILFRGSVIQQAEIEKDILKKIIRFFLQTDIPVMFGGTDNIYSTRKSEKFPDVNFLPITSENDFETKYKDDKIQKMEIFLPDIPQEAKNILDGCLNVYYHDWYIEANPKGFSKTTAMEYLSEYLNIPNSRCIAMGDSVNDLDMLTHAGISVAMGNAIDEVKSIADFVSTACRENGVCHALKKLILDKTE